MCELLVNLVDTSNPDPLMDVGCYKAGDVITVQEDGWLWGSMEVGNTNWSIVKLPGAPAKSFLSLLNGQAAPNPLAPSPMLQLRAASLDLAALGLSAPAVPPVTGGKLGGKRGGGIVAGPVGGVASITDASVTAAQIVKPFLATPSAPTP